MKSDPLAIVLKPTAAIELVRQDADGTLTFRIREPGCSITEAFWLHTCDELQEGGFGAGILSMKRVMIGSKGGLALQ